MGINLVVIVENSRRISLEAFKTGLLEDKVVGPHAWPPRVEGGFGKFSPWEDFTWDNRSYFTWIFAPRLSTFDFYQFDAENDQPDECAITFLKIMRLAEKVAGGPVHIGNDVVHASYPEDVHEKGGLSFWIPGELDLYVENWRDIAQLDAAPLLIF